MSDFKEKVLAWRSRLPLRKAVAIEVIALMVGGALILPGGEDLYVSYLLIAKGCPQCGFSPWYTSWILFPIQFVPERYLWAAWVLFTGVVVFWAAEQLGTNSAFVLLAFPMMGQMWLGQTDALIILGLMIAFLSPNPYMRGVGYLLASTKPHVAGAAMLVLLWYDQARWKALIVPVIVFVASLIVWEPGWLIQWWHTRDLIEIIQAPINVWMSAILFPYALPAFLAILLVKDRRQKLTAALLASMLSLPSIGIYSYTVFLVFLAPWWALPLSYAWAVAYPWYGNTALRFAWTLPLGLLIYLLWPVIKEHWPKLKARLSHNCAVP